jgi:hypothetical protein
VKVSAAIYVTCRDVLVPFFYSYVKKSREKTQTQDWKDVTIFS